MNKPQIVDTLVEASFYTISEETFIQGIKRAGVTSYVIDIYNYSVTFKGIKGVGAYKNSKKTTDTIVINLIKTNDYGDPLFVHLLKKEAVTHYEVFLSDMRIVYYKNCGTVKDFLS